MEQQHRQLWRVLAPEGRLLIVAPEPAGLPRTGSTSHIEQVEFRLDRGELGKIVEMPAAAE